MGRGEGKREGKEEEEGGKEERFEA